MPGPDATSPDGGEIECTLCGACCVAPDIAAIDKPLGIRCAHLTADNLCGVYEDRPDICKSYAADKLCLEIAAPTLDERVHNYLAKFGLLEEAARNRALAASSMRASRSLPIVRP